MLKMIDRALAGLLLLGAAGHTFGVTQLYAGQPMILFWSLSAGALTFLLAALNFMRAGRPRDRSFAWVTLAGTLCQLVITLRFGTLIGDMLDPRVIFFSIICLGLGAFGLRSALGRA
ncbi:MAG: hypothetical protein ABI240_18705 [Sphingomonas sp.]